MMRALFVILVACLLAACGKSEPLPKSLEDAKLTDRQWSEADFRLAAKISMQTAIELQPTLADLAKRGDGVAAVDAGGKIIMMLHSWGAQQDAQLVTKFRPCKLALAYVLDEANAIFHSGDFDVAKGRFDANRKACAEI